MTSPPSLQDQAAFYDAAVLGLRALDRRENTPRRFGADADGRWKQFAGALGPGDRIDILLRDAAGVWGAAFSPAECFGLFGLAEDEPFGPDWRTIDDSAAKRLLSEEAKPAAIDQIASTLGVKTATIPVPTLAPSTKLVVAGGAAVAAVARAFVKDDSLSWSDQVLVVADKPAWRQLAGLAAVLLGARSRTVLIRPAAAADSTAFRASGFAHLDASVTSPDAEAEAAELAQRLGGK